MRQPVIALHETMNTSGRLMIRQNILALEHDLGMIQALQIFMFLWFWFTPVLYPIESVPAEFQYLFRLNPVAVIVTGYRSSLLHLRQPGLVQTAIVMMVCIAVFVLGGLLFRQ